MRPRSYAATPAFRGNSGVRKWRQASAPAVEPGVPPGGSNATQVVWFGTPQPRSGRQDAALYGRRGRLPPQGSTTASGRRLRELDPSPQQRQRRACAEEQKTDEHDEVTRRRDAQQFVKPVARNERQIRQRTAQHKPGRPVAEQMEQRQIMPTAADFGHDNSDLHQRGKTEGRFDVGLHATGQIRKNGR